MGIDRTIAIVGTDFCGSTLLSRLLWLCPGVAAIGEVHAYLRKGAKKYMGCCDICGRACGLLDIGKKTTARSLYKMVAEWFECTKYTTMIVSDKEPRIYELTLASWIAEPLILFREPWAYGSSEEKRGRRSFAGGILQWTQTYSRALEAYPDATVVSFESLLRGLPGSLGILAEALGLPAPAPLPKNLDAIEWHHVGGSNSGRKSTEIDLQKALVAQRDVPVATTLLLNCMRKESVI